MSDAEKNKGNVTAAVEDDGFGDMGLGFPPEAEEGKSDGEGAVESTGGKKVRAKKEPGLRKRAEKPALTPKDKFLKKLFRKAGVNAAPELSQIIEGKVGKKVAIKDIGIFLGDVKDEVLKPLAKECAVENRINDSSAEVLADHVLSLGAEIIRDGRMFLAPNLAKITEDGALECVSGRHRLAFLGLLYGADAEIPVHIDEMTLNVARNAVVRANEARSTKAMERAGHAVLAAVGGDASVKQDEMYEKVVKSKKSAGKYCLYSVVHRKHPCKLAFLVSQTAGRKDGGLTTFSILESYWNSALKWDKDTDRKAFDHALKASTEFLNAIVEAMKSIDGFEPKQHLADKTLRAVGKYYVEASAIKGDQTPHVKKIAKAVVSMGEVGLQPSEKTYAALGKAMQK